MSRAIQDARLVMEALRAAVGAARSSLRVPLVDVALPLTQVSPFGDFSAELAEEGGEEAGIAKSAWRDLRPSEPPRAAKPVEASRPDAAAGRPPEPPAAQAPTAPVFPLRTERASWRSTAPGAGSQTRLPSELHITERVIGAEAPPPVRRPDSSEAESPEPSGSSGGQPSYSWVERVIEEAAMPEAGTSPDSVAGDLPETPRRDVAPVRNLYVEIETLVDELVAPEETRPYTAQGMETPREAGAFAHDGTPGPAASAREQAGQQVGRGTEVLAAAVLDAEDLAALVNEALMEQARLHGVDLV